MPLLHWGHGALSQSARQVEDQEIGQRGRDVGLADEGLVRSDLASESTEKASVTFCAPKRFYNFESSSTVQTSAYNNHARVACPRNPKLREALEVCSG